MVRINGVLSLLSQSALQRSAVAGPLSLLLVACGGGSSDPGASDPGATDASEDGASEDHGDEDHGDDESSGGLGAHEHGTAELTVAWAATEVVVDLVSPTHNIFGFEHEPSTDDEEALVLDRMSALTAPDALVFNVEAGCSLMGDPSTEIEYDNGHAEVEASWVFACEHPEDIRELDLSSLFGEFPNLTEIDAQWASPAAQSAAQLSPEQAVLGLE